MIYNNIIYNIIECLYIKYLYIILFVYIVYIVYTTGLKTPHAFPAAKLPSEQQPYCVPAHPPISFPGASEDFGSSTRDVP